MNADGRQRRVSSRTLLTAGSMTFVPAFAAALLLHRYVPALDWMQSWLAAVTVITFLTYGYDKLIAGTSATRVPEKVLLTLAFG